MGEQKTVCHCRDLLLPRVMSSARAESDDGKVKKEKGETKNVPSI